MSNWFLTRWSGSQWSNVLGALALLTFGFLAGRLSLRGSAQTSLNPAGLSGHSTKSTGLHTVQNVQSDQAQVPGSTQNDPRELIPLPGPGQQQGQQPQPGQGQQPQNCPVYLYQDGKLYVLPQPGQQPQPGQGQGNTPGQGGPQELIPLNPGGSSPNTPSTPSTPSTPGAPNPFNPATPSTPNNRS